MKPAYRRLAASYRGAKNGELETLGRRYARRRERELLRLTLAVASFDATALKRSVSGWDVGLPVRDALAIQMPGKRPKELWNAPTQDLEQAATDLRGVLLEATVAAHLNAGHAIGGVVLQEGQHARLEGSAGDPWTLVVEGPPALQQRVERTFGPLRHLIDTHPDLIPAGPDDIIAAATWWAGEIGPAGEDAATFPLRLRAPGGSDADPPALLVLDGHPPRLATRTAFEAVLEKRCEDASHLLACRVALDQGVITEAAALQARLRVSHASEETLTAAYKQPRIDMVTLAAAG